MIVIVFSVLHHILILERHCLLQIRIKKAIILFLICLEAATGGVL